MMLPKWGQQLSTSRLLLEWWKDPKKQKYQEQKMIKGYSLVMWRVRRKWSTVCCALEEVAGTASGSLWRKGCSISSCHSLYNCATLLLSGRLTWPLLQVNGFMLHHLWWVNHRIWGNLNPDMLLLVINSRFQHLPFTKSSGLHWKKKSILKRQQPKVKCQKLCNIFQFVPLPQCAFVTVTLDGWDTGTYVLPPRVATKSMFAISKENKRRANKLRLQQICARL